MSMVRNQGLFRVPATTVRKESQLAVELHWMDDRLKMLWFSLMVRGWRANAFISVRLLFGERKYPLHEETESAESISLLPHSFCWQRLSLQFLSYKCIDSVSSDFSCSNTETEPRISLACTTAANGLGSVCCLGSASILYMRKRRAQSPFRYCPIHSAGKD